MMQYEATLANGRIVRAIVEPIVRPSVAGDCYLNIDGQEMMALYPIETAEDDARRLVRMRCGKVASWRTVE